MESWIWWVSNQWQAEERLLEVFHLEVRGDRYQERGNCSRETIRATRLLRSLDEYRMMGLKVTVSTQKRAPSINLFT